MPDSLAQWLLILALFFPLKLLSDHIPLVNNIGQQRSPNQILFTPSASYSSYFLADSWQGTLYQYVVDNHGKYADTPQWEAGSNIPAADLRQILSFDHNSGILFNASALSSESLSLIGGKESVSYLRGDQSKELGQLGGIYRPRLSLLGDIMHSSPQYSASPQQHYPDNIAADSYHDFKAKHQQRPAVIYVGANDGMLHAFAEKDGSELFAYIPHAVFNKLNHLTQIDYRHHYYVDASPTIMDAYIQHRWRTVLVCGLGRGGQAIFALDITDPTTMSSEHVLWEFSDNDTAELGFTDTPASIIKLNTGQWAALFSGGFNNHIDNHNDGAANDSASGNPHLFLLDLASGQEIRRFSIAAPTAKNNAFTTPTAVDTNGDAVADLIYVGDRLGNLWKINLTSSQASAWDFDVSQPLFRTTRARSIHQRIVVQRHADSGYRLLFETKDQLGNTQLYAIHDADDGKSAVDISAELTTDSLDEFIEEHTLKMTGRQSWQQL